MTSQLERDIIIFVKFQLLKPQSCDTFVVLPPLTHNGVIFGKNSDRPQGEVQEVVYFPATKNTDSTKVNISK